MDDREDFYAEPDFDASPLDDLYRALTPLTAVLMHRESFIGCESLWLSAYEGVIRGRGLIVQTLMPKMVGGRRYPGVVTETPTGPTADVSEVFYGKACALVAIGWKHIPAAHVWSGDPWDVSSVLDEGPTF